MNATKYKRLAIAIPSWKKSLLKFDCEFFCNASKHVSNWAIIVAIANKIKICSEIAW